MCDVEYIEKESDGLSAQPSDPDIYSGVSELKEHYSDRVSNSGNLVVKYGEGGHKLGSHGPVEEYVKIPYEDGDTVYVSPPRLHRQPRVLVCRDQDIVWSGDSIEYIKQPKLRTEDIVPVHLPLRFDSTEPIKEVHPEETDWIPLPLFANVDILRTSRKLDNGWQ